MLIECVHIYGCCKYHRDHINKGFRFCTQCLYDQNNQHWWWKVTWSCHYVTRNKVHSPRIQAAVTQMSVTKIFIMRIIEMVIQKYIVLFFNQLQNLYAYLIQFSFNLYYFFLLRFPWKIYLLIWIFKMAVRLRLWTAIDNSRG